MSEDKLTLRAIDLYSGVGGWSLGLSLAGIKVVCSYERWDAANETNFKNNNHNTKTMDIRELSNEDLPKNIQVVVGSPPCTQFSYSNRGGSGDIEDGFADIVKFFEVVDFLKPRFWAMENVPRIKKFIEVELLSGGRLERFKHLGIKQNIVSMDDFGVPQRRKRCIVSNTDFDLLHSYSSAIPKIQIKDVITSLVKKQIHDPIYGRSLAISNLRDNYPEDFLNEEEQRINRANKLLHPVYNKMQFPDPIADTARTITATCTRVSRESIVIEDLISKGKYRRLTVREKACIQGFPVNYQFYATSHAQKNRMIGNALPPPFAYYIAQTFLKTKPKKLPPLREIGRSFVGPKSYSIETSPDRPGSKFRKDRRFRFSVPSLRLPSGVRFELVNTFEHESTDWRVDFVFGTPKSIQKLELQERLFKQITQRIPVEVRYEIETIMTNLKKYILGADVARLQDVWSHTGPGLTRPFMILDELDRVGETTKSVLRPYETFAISEIQSAIKFEYRDQAEALLGMEKLVKNAPLILSGILIGSCANTNLAHSSFFAGKQKRKMVS